MKLHFLGKLFWPQFGVVDTILEKVIKTENSIKNCPVTERLGPWRQQQLLYKHSRVGFLVQNEIQVPKTEDCVCSEVRHSDGGGFTMRKKGWGETPRRNLCLGK